MSSKSIMCCPGRYVMLDLETTGLSSRTNSIIEIGAVRYVQGVEAESFQSLLRPPEIARNFFIPYQIEALTGITNGMLRGAPEAAGVIERFRDFLGDDIVADKALSAHGAQALGHGRVLRP